MTKSELQELSLDMASSRACGGFDAASERWHRADTRALSGRQAVMSVKQTLAVVSSFFQHWVRSTLRVPELHKLPDPMRLQGAHKHWTLFVSQNDWHVWLPGCSTALRLKFMVASWHRQSDGWNTVSAWGSWILPVRESSPLPSYTCETHNLLHLTVRLDNPHQLRSIPSAQLTFHIVLERCFREQSHFLQVLFRPCPMRNCYILHCDIHKPSLHHPLLASYLQWPWMSFISPPHPCAGSSPTALMHYSLACPFSVSRHSNDVSWLLTYTPGLQHWYASQKK